MSEHDEPRKPALDDDNPPQREDDGEKGLGSETGAEGAAVDEGRDVTDLMPEARGEVRYPDVEDPDDVRPTAVPQEGEVEEDPDRSHDASSGAD